MRQSCPWTLLIALSHAGIAIADWQFRSRPDLSPPKLNITIPATSDVEQGYIFVTPTSSKRDGVSGPEQPAAYIFRNDGDLVWSSIGYLSGYVCNFQVTRVAGQDVLQAFQGTIDYLHGHGYGHTTLLDQNYESVRETRNGNHRITSIHEFRVVDERTALAESFQQTPMDLSAYGGSEGQQWIADGIFQEFDVMTGEILFEWSSLDHVDPSKSMLSLPEGHAASGYTSADAWDYFHINSIDKDEDGNYLISARHACAIYKINGRTGDIIWQLGGKDSDFTIPEEAQFAFQHDARFRGNEGDLEIISLFDNSAKVDGHPDGSVPPFRNYSSAKIVQLNTTNMSAVLLQNLVHPDRVLAPSQGNTQVLPNGNIFVNWGQAGTITEFRANDSVPIFNAYLDSGVRGQHVQSYRGFRFNWTGIPNEKPAIVSLIREDGKLLNCVSWNGDTETTIWRFFGGGQKQAQKEFLGEKTRTTFETCLEVEVVGEDWHEHEVFAQAIDLDGQAISRTRLTKPKPEIKPHASTLNGPTEGQDALQQIFSP